MRRHRSDAGNSLETPPGKTEKCKMQVVLRILRQGVGCERTPGKGMQMQAWIEIRIYNGESNGERKEEIYAETGRWGVL